MSKAHKMHKSVEADPEWFLGGVPLPPKLADRWSVQSESVVVNRKASHAKPKEAARRKYIRKVLRELAYGAE